MRNPTVASLIGACVLAAAFVAAACYLCPPIWETNDDVAMAMIAHGYGIAAVGTPNIFFSNVLWGHLVRLVPTFGGIEGYAGATLGVLVVVGTVTIHALRRFGLGMVTCAAAFFLVLLRAVLIPQFTVNAGLLTVAAVLCWQMYASTGNRGSLVAGHLLAYLGYLVRDQECALVLLVAAPLLPWRMLFAGRVGKAATAAFATAIVTAAALNHSAYQGPEWRYFNELNAARAPLTDFGASHALSSRPDILKRHGYSVNDIHLVADWFLVDPQVDNPQALGQMLHELGPLPAAQDLRTDVFMGVSVLWMDLLPAALAALLLALIFPSWRLLASWGIFFAAIIAMALAGRPGLLRVYIPLLCLLLIAPLVFAGDLRPRRHLAAGLLLVAAATVSGLHVIADGKFRYQTSEYVQQALKDFPTDPVVVWGAVFPFQWAYPVLGASSTARSYELYGLGASTWAPFSRSYAEQAAGRGLVTRLLSTQGVPMVMDEIGMKDLEIYCREHFQGRLEQLSHRSYDVLSINQVRCKTSP